MPEVLVANPAEVAAQRALDEVFQCIRERKSFRLEAGAGAGKTYSLVKALQLIIDEEGAQLVRRHQRVACITYTNVATDEVIRRTDGHPAVQASTIHSFCWELCKSFQAVLRSEVMNIPQLLEKINEVGEIGARRISYDLGHRRVTDTEILNLLYFRGQCEKSYLQSKGDIKHDTDRQPESQTVQQRVQGRCC